MIYIFFHITAYIIYCVINKLIKIYIINNKYFIYEININEIWDYNVLNTSNHNNNCKYIYIRIIIIYGYKIKK